MVGVAAYPPFDSPTCWRRKLMKKPSTQRLLKLLVPGMVLLQVAGCDLVALNEIVQTVFLGITAAGSIAILQNI